MTTKARKVRKNLRLTQSKLDRARRLLGTETETETVEQALDNFAAAEKQLSVETIQAMRDLWARDIESDPLPW